MYRKADNEDLSRAQFDSARLGFYQLLRRKRMSPQFRDRHAEDLFAQACSEYSRRVFEGVKINDPPAWIVTCAWNRTKSLLETRDYRPRLVSIDGLPEPVDDRSGPEEALLDEDRAQKVRDALKELPLYQRELLALSYFEDESVREAGRRLGWTASKAQRAHEAAQKKIFGILGVDSSDELQLEIGLFAFLTVCAERATGHALPAGVEAALDRIHHGLSEACREVLSVAHRPFAGSEDPGGALAPQAATVADRAATVGGRGPLGRIAGLGRRLAGGGFGEAGTALAGEGGGRALEVCKGLAVCALGVSAITAALVGGGAHVARPAAYQRPPAKVVEKADEPVRSTDGPPTVSLAAEPNSANELPSQDAPAKPPRPAERHRSVAAAAKAGASTTEPSGGEAEGRTEVQEVEEEFRNFAATEEPAAGSPAARPSSVADPSARPGTDTQTTASPAEKAKETQAVEEFQGILK